ncbi:MAG: FAD binding domain-containing protein, partial [Geminicoccaceae bacterium]
ACIALGACSPVAMRLGALERDLVGTPLEGFAKGLGEMVSMDHLDQLRPIDDIRATAGYRKDAALVLVRRSLSLAAAGLR